MPPARTQGRLRSEHGFTLVELLIAVVIIGVLAAIAIPSFLSQAGKGHDASAKSQVNHLVKLIEACKVEEKTYAKCDEASEVGATEEISWGIGEGNSGVINTDDDGFIAYSISKAKTGNKNHVFAWQRDSSGVTTRLCLNSALQPLNSGGCRDSKW